MPEQSQDLMQNISSILTQLLGSGIAINGQISINGLTLTSVDKAKEMRILKTPEGEASEEQQSQQGQSSDKKSQAGSKDQSPQDEINNLREEVRQFVKHFPLPSDLARRVQ